MSKENIIIFGSNGQDGFYLNKLLTKLPYNVINISRTNATICGSVADYKFVEKHIKEYTPKFIFHFAANSTTKHEAIFENHQSISTGTFNILESVRLFSQKTKVFLSGSAMQFKNEGNPIDELSEFEGSSPYSISRIQSVYASRYFYKTFGIKSYVGYLFNHDSPLRSIQHVNQKIVKAVQDIKHGSSQKLQLGNIEVKKEFNFAGDIVEAIWQLVNQDILFETVIGNGLAYSIKDWVAYCFQSCGINNWQDHVELSNSFKAEYSILVSNPNLIKSLGWSPKTDFYKLADLMIQST